MTAVLLGAAWATVVAVGVGLELHRPARVAALVHGARRTRTPMRLSKRVRAAVAFVIPLPVLSAPWNVGAGFVAAAAITWMPAWQVRRAERDRRTQLENELPEIVDLLALAAGAGLTVPLALEAVARRGVGLLADELSGAVAASRQGHRLADALERLPDHCGEAIRPLTAALVSTERYGAPLTDGLERLGAEVRASRRRRADEAARKVSVKLLFPLVLCILPAFALLTVAPLIAGALRSLRL